MPKQDSDLFDRLRKAGLRKPVAKALSSTSEDATKKLQRAARRAVAELRVLADEIEKRLPTEPELTPATATRTAAAKKPATPRKTTTPARKPAATTPARTPAATTPARKPAATTTRTASKPRTTTRATTRRTPPST